MRRVGKNGHPWDNIGSYIVDNLFPDEEPLGKRLIIEGKSFTIVGTLVRKGSFLGQTQDNLLLIPLATFEKNFKPQGEFGAMTHSLTITIEPKRKIPIKRAIDHIRELIRRRHNP